MTETPFFFGKETTPLFGVLHAPASESSATAFVMSHPFAEEKLWSHRVFVSLARALASRGHAVLRFDYTGAGDSAGSTSETSLASHLEDLETAIQELRSRRKEVEQVGLAGLRLGASFAALVAERAAAGGACSCVQDAPLILAEPVVDGENYFQELLRSNLSTQLAAYGKVRENREVLQERIRAGGAVNVDGYEITAGLFESCARADLLPAQNPKAHTGRTLVVQLAATSSMKDREDLQALARSYANGTFMRVTEQPFWREIKPFYSRAESLQRVILEWLEPAHVEG